MKTQPKSPIVVVTAVLLGFSALAVARGADRVVPEGTVPSSRSNAAAEPLCPPSACTIVFKTETGGPPSRIVHVD